MGPRSRRARCQVPFLSEKGYLTLATLTRNPLSTDNIRVKKNYWVPFALIVFVLLLIVFEPSYGWKFRNLFARPGVGESDSNTALQNEALKAEVAMLQSISAQFPTKPAGYVRAMVYSRYPMNFKNEISIDAGRNEGVIVGHAVTFGGVLIGRIEKVFDDTSLVETVFDSRFQAPVRIGTEGADALFNGGALPKATLIPLKSSVAKGDVVYSASPDFPYGLALGEINDTNIQQDQLFREAPVNFVYDINGIKTVLVAK